MIKDTVQAMDPKPRLELIPHSLVSNPCAFDHDGIPIRFTINRKYWLRDLPKERNISIAQQVATHWSRVGHAIVSQGGFKEGKPGVHARSIPDGFLIALSWTAGDNLYLAATSPCLAPHETPPS